MGFRGNKMSNLFEKMLSGDIKTDRRAAVNSIRNKSDKQRKAVAESNRKQYADGTRTFPKNCTMKGRVFTAEHRANIGLAGRGPRPHHVERGTYAKENNGFWKKKHTDDYCENHKETALNREVDQHCDHCDKDFTRQHYKQHHGDNCTQNPNRILKKFIIATHIKTNKTIKGGSMSDPIFEKHGLLRDGIRGCLNGSRESYKDYTFTTNANRKSYKDYTDA